MDNTSNSKPKIKFVDIAHNIFMTILGIQMIIMMSIFIMLFASLYDKDITQKKSQSPDVLQCKPKSIHDLFRDMNTK